MNKLVIAVRSLKRHEYLEQCLDSLAGCHGASSVDFYFLQNGPVNQHSGVRYATDEEVEKSLQVFKDSKIKNKTIKVTEGLGSHEQKWHILTEVFDKKGYDYAVLVDNDLVFSKYYLHTLMSLFATFKNSDFGMIQTSYRYTPETPIETLEFAEANKDKLHEGFSYRWEQGFWKRSWDKIKPRFRKYVDAVGGRDFHMMFKARPQELIDEFGGFSADHNLELAVQKAGLKGLCTNVLRHKTIGKEGFFTSDSANWKKNRFDEIIIHEVA